MKHAPNIVFICVSIPQCTAAILAIILTQFNLNENDRHRRIANTLTHVSLGLVFISLFCDIIKMNFGLDPAVPIPKETAKP